jgi:hypothetical protein
MIQIILVGSKYFVKHDFVCFGAYPRVFRSDSGVVEYDVLEVLGATAPTDGWAQLLLRSARRSINDFTVGNRGRYTSVYSRS